MKRKGLALVLVAMLLLTAGCSQDRRGTYKRATSLFAEGKYAEAAEVFTRLGDYEQATVYAAYAQGLVYWEQGDYVAATPYFEQTQGFMYGQQRYQYCLASQYEAQEDFASAATEFQAMGEFEDAPTRATYCEARNAEGTKDYETALYNYAALDSYADSADRLMNLRIQVYNYAIELKTGGNYRDAMYLFSALGDYLSSPAYARECKDYFRNQQYDEADALLASGDVRGAYEAFSGLAGFRDAETRAQELAAQLGVSTSPDPNE